MSEEKPKAQKKTKFGHLGFLSEKTATYDLVNTPVTNERHAIEVQKLEECGQAYLELQNAPDITSKELSKFLHAWKISHDSLRKYDLRNPELNSLFKQSPSEERRMTLFFEESWDSVLMSLFDTYQARCSNVNEHEDGFREKILQRIHGDRYKVSIDEILDMSDSLSQDDKLALTDLAAFSLQYRQDVLNNVVGFLKPKHLQLKVDTLNELKPLFFQMTEEFSDILAADKSNSVAIDGLTKIFEVLHNVNEMEMAEEILFNKNLSSEQRLRIAVEYANSCGLMKLITALSKQIKLETDENLKNDYLETYRVIQADTLVEAMENFEGVYEDYDYNEYSISGKEKELAESEADKVTLAILRHQPDLNPEDGIIVDAGSATGRNMKVLVPRGWEVRGVEYQSQYVGDAKQALLDMGVGEGRIFVYQDDWRNLPEAVELEEERADALYSFHRSGSHSEDMGAWMQKVDAETRTIKKGVGVLIYDQPEPNWGYYDFNVTKYADNMEKLGIKRSEALRICDGIVETKKFNRIVLTRKQVEAMAFLFGLELENVEEVDLNEEVKNVYYEHRRKEDFDPREINHASFCEAIDTLGLVSDRSVDLNTYFPSWGMTIAQGLMFGLGHKDDVNSNWAENIREYNQSGRIFPIEVRYENGETFLSMSDAPLHRKPNG